MRSRTRWKALPHSRPLKPQKRAKTRLLGSQGHSGLAIYFPNLPFQAEYRFHPTRKWRFDLCLPSCMVAVEQEGAVWTGGRHTRGSGYLKDMEKYNEAAILGWFVLRFTPEQIRNGTALRDVYRFLRIPVSRLNPTGG